MPEDDTRPEAGSAPLLTRRKFLLLGPVLVAAGWLGYTATQRNETLVAFVDTLLPEDEFGPAGSQVGAVEALHARFSGKPIRQGELHLLAGWLNLAAFGSFVAASPERRHAIVERIDRLPETDVRWKIYRRARGAVMYKYFSSASRAEAMGLSGAPQPGGFPDAHKPYLRS